MEKVTLEIQLKSMQTRKAPYIGVQDVKSALYRWNRNISDLNSSQVSDSGTDSFSGQIGICKLYTNICAMY